MTNHSTSLLSALGFSMLMFSCTNPVKTEPVAEKEKPLAQSEKPEYFMLRPETEKAYGYTHGVKIGNEIKVSGAISMDDKGVSTAKGDLLQQMKNCYSDLDKILKHYGCTFDDVIVENVLTTNMPELLKQSAYRSPIYKKQFLTGFMDGRKRIVIA